MIERYTLPEMGRLWSEDAKFQTWLEVELLACEAWAEQGAIPAEALEVIRNKARFDVRRITELEQTLRHDVVAFTTNLAENIGPESRYVHMGLTSSDVVDTALSMQMVRAADILIRDVEALVELLRGRALEHRRTLIMGRTHGIHAEPITLGLKFLVWYKEMQRNRERLERARETVRVGKISGAVGTYAHTGRAIERYVCEKLGLVPAPISTQIIQRDRHAEYLSALAVCGGTVEKIATEIRNLQRTEIAELEEPFGRGQKGSSAMPHKRNPVTCEQLSGLARVLRGNAAVALQNIALWHERDISHSSTERIIIPDSTILLDYMLQKMHWIIAEMRINTEQMAANLERTRGLLFSQKVLLALVEKGMPREKAYELVQRNAMKTWLEGGTFRENMLRDEDVKPHLSPGELDRIMDYASFVRYVDDVYRACGIEG